MRNKLFEHNGNIFEVEFPYHNTENRIINEKLYGKGAKIQNYKQAIVYKFCLHGNMGMQ
jgi:hypothetical protein